MWEGWKRGCAADLIRLKLIRCKKMKTSKEEGGKNGLAEKKQEKMSEIVTRAILLGKKELSKN